MEITMKRGVLWLLLALMATPAFGQAVPRDPVAGNVVGTAISAAFSGANTTSATATLSGVANKTTYICGFTVSGLGATAATNVIVTVTGLVGGTGSITYSYAGTATTANATLNLQFSMCIPASAVNTSIVVTVPGAAGNTATQINAHGYQL